MTSINPGPASSATANDQLATQNYVKGAIEAATPTLGSIQTVLTAMNRIALVGDSIAEFNIPYANVPTSAGSFVVKNGIATLTMGATTSVFTGNYFSLNNVSDAAFSLPDNGAFIQALSGSTPAAGSTVITYASKMGNGDYSNYNGGTWNVADVAQNSDKGLVTWLNQNLRGQYMITANYAAVGEKSTQTLAKIPKILAGVPFDIAFLSCDGINDLNLLSPAATAYAYVATVFANYINCIQQLQAGGKTVWVQLPVPCNLTTGSGNVVNAKCFLQLRQLLAAYCQKNNQVVVFDAMKEMIAGQSTTGGYTTNSVGQFSADLTHPNANAYSTMAANENAYLSGLLKPSEISPVSILDDNFNYAAAQFGYQNFAPNSGLAGTSGTLSGSPTPTGSAAATWTLASVGTPTSVTGTGNATPTQVTGTNSQNYGYAQRIQCSTSGANQGFAFKAGQFYTNAVFPGWYRFGFRVYVRAATTGLGALYAQYGVGPKNMNFGGDGSFDVGYILPQGQVLWIFSGPLYLSTAPSIGQLLLQYNSAGAGSVDLEVQAPFIRPIDNPYV